MLHTATGEKIKQPLKLSNYSGILLPSCTHLAAAAPSQLLTQAPASVSNRLL